MVEAHDVPGGYAHSFKMGEYNFCAQIHYIWGCEPGGVIHGFLSKLKIEQKIKFKPYARSGYDHITLPTGKTVKIPCGFEKLAQNIDRLNPGEGAKIRKFTKILTQIRTEMALAPVTSANWEKYLIIRPLRFKTILKYSKRTLQDVYDECDLSMESQAVLSGNAGNFGSPRELPRVSL